MHNSTSVQNLQLHGPTWVSRMLAHASQSLTTSNKDMTLLHGTQSNTDRCMWVWLVKVQSSVARAHAPVLQIACSTCSEISGATQPNVCSRHLFSTAHVGSVPRWDVQFGRVVWFPNHADPPNEPSLFSFLVCYCPWLFLLPQRGCNGELKVFFCMFFTEQGT